MCLPLCLCALRPGCEKRYHFSPFTCTLNEMEEGVAPTDSRYRPDQRIMEEGDFDKANTEKVCAHVKLLQMCVHLPILHTYTLPQMYVHNNPVILHLRFVWKRSREQNAELVKQRQRQQLKQLLVVMRTWPGPWKQRPHTALSGSRSNLTPAPTPWSMSTKEDTGRQSERNNFLHCQIYFRQEVAIHCMTGSSCFVN